MIHGACASRAVFSIKPESRVSETQDGHVQPELNDARAIDGPRNTFFGSGTPVVRGCSAASIVFLWGAVPSRGSADAEQGRSRR